MSILRTYDPTKVNITFNSWQLRMFGDSLFTLARDEANVTLKKGVKGDSTYILNANKAGKLTITLQQESPDIPYLEECAEKYVKAPVAITDANDSGLVFFAQDCMVEKLPDRVRGKDAPDVSFVFLIPEIQRYYGGTLGGTFPLIQVLGAKFKVRENNSTQCSTPQSSNVPGIVPPMFRLKPLRTKRFARYGTLEHSFIIKP